MVVVSGKLSKAHPSPEDLWCFVCLVNDIVKSLDDPLVTIVVFKGEKNPVFPLMRRN